MGVVMMRALHMLYRSHARGRRQSIREGGLIFGSSSAGLAVSTERWAGHQVEWL